jgi:hypothetical protein
MCETTLLLAVPDLLDLCRVVENSLHAEGMMRDVPDVETRALHARLASCVSVTDSPIAVALSHLEVLELKSIMSAMDALGVERFPELAEHMVDGRLTELSTMVWEATHLP